jgi:hypothetical protein
MIEMNKRRSIDATTYKYDVEEDVVVADVDELPIEALERAVGGVLQRVVSPVVEVPVDVLEDAGEDAAGHVGHRDRVAGAPPVLQHAPDRHRRGADRLRTDIEPLAVRACQADHVLRRRRLRGGCHKDRSFSTLGFVTPLCR